MIKEEDFFKNEIEKEKVLNDLRENFESYGIGHFFRSNKEITKIANNKIKIKKIGGIKKAQLLKNIREEFKIKGTEYFLRSDEEITEIELGYLSE